MQYRRWTDAEVAELRRLALRYPASQVAAKLGRRLLDTSLKARELRISLSIGPRWESGDSNLDPGPAGMDLKG